MLVFFSGPTLTKVIPFNDLDMQGIKTPIMIKLMNEKTEKYSEGLKKLEVVRL